jgi:hypothetical protein
MNFSNIASRQPRIFQYLLFLVTSMAVLVGLAHTQGEKADRILIDGAKEPDRIPDWILWDATFQLAVHLNEKSPKHGEEIWMDRLQLPKAVMKEIVDQGYAHAEMADDIEREAQELASDSKKDQPKKINHPNKTEGLRIHLKKVQLNKESRILEMRDRLRQRIGEDAFLRLSSFARLQLSPRIKIGG